MGYDDSATRSSLGMPRGISLYGSLPQQLEDPNSFAMRLKVILDLRSKYSIATSHQIDVPQVAHKGLLVAVHELRDAATAGSSPLQATVLNFSLESFDGSVRSEHLPPGSTVTDMLSGEALGTVDDLNTFRIELGPHEGTSLLIEPPTDTS